MDLLRRFQGYSRMKSRRVGVSAKNAFAHGVCRLCWVIKPIHIRSPDSSAARLRVLKKVHQFHHHHRTSEDQKNLVIRTASNAAYHRHGATRRCRSGWPTYRIMTDDRRRRRTWREGRGGGGGGGGGTEGPPLLKPRNPTQHTHTLFPFLRWRYAYGNKSRSKRLVVSIGQSIQYYEHRHRQVPVRDYTIRVLDKGSVASRPAPARILHEHWNSACVRASE